MARESDERSEARRLGDFLGERLRALVNTPRLWEWEIARYEAADRRKPPPRSAVLFTGSSTIRFWRTLERDMAPLSVLNRGFGGAHLAHVTHFASRVVLPYAPSAIVLYAGDNDLGARTGKTASDVVNDLDAFLCLVRRRLRGTPVYCVSIKPSRLRREQWSEQQRANRAIEERAGEEPDLEYIDVAGPMLQGAELPARDLFAWDGLHLSARGYEVWTEAIRPVLLRDLGHLRA